MGPVSDRTREFLGTSDKAIVAMRRLLLDAIEINEKGGNPPGLRAESTRAIRPHDNIVAKNQDWRNQFAQELIAKW
jgi:hypothetical protein